MINGRWQVEIGDYVLIECYIHNIIRYEGYIIGFNEYYVNLVDRLVADYQHLIRHEDVSIDYILSITKLNYDYDLGI